MICKFRELLASYNTFWISFTAEFSMTFTFGKVAAVADKPAP